MLINSILIADDEVLIRTFIAETLRRQGKTVSVVCDGEDAIALLKEKSFDLVITDMKMPNTTGLDVLRHVKTHCPKTLVILITAHGSIETAIEATRLGAFNYLIKPFSPDAIETIIEKAEEHLSLLEENATLRKQISHGKKHTLIAESPAMKKILCDIEKIAKSSASVFISGESGTGKEVIAQAIHYHSPREKESFIRVNCAAIPETLVESEFFGHEKGAFTGAHSRKAGRFELAHKGTLLLDEVTEIPLALQPKLLRAIQEGEFERVGGTKPIQVDVRLVATSNRNMKEATETKVFREDLYYRLNVIPIHIPPLRERPEDVLALAEFFLEKFCFENHKRLKILTKEAKKKLLSYSWPGNVRELANIIERTIVLDFERDIAPDHLYIDPKETTSKKDSFPQGMTLKELEKRVILQTLEKEKQNRTKTAETLGISIRTLRNKLKEYQKI